MTEFNDDYQELPDDSLFPDEHELKKKIHKLQNELNKANKKLESFRDEQAKDIKKLVKQHDKALENTSSFYNEQLEDLREQNRILFERYHEVHEMSKIFVKGLENLKKEGIRVTESISWKRKGVHGSLEKRISEISINKRVISITAVHVDSHGFTDEALIVVEYYRKS